ncbi:MAG: efflux RND transporter periplasmic adaptor subunit [Candidatus Desantisbacteria bacterium]
MLTKKVFFKIFISLLFIIIGWILCNIYHNLNQQKEIPEVTTVAAGRGKICEKIGLSTKVQEKEVVNITSSVEKGRVDKVFVKTGDFVVVGQILVELRRDELVNTLKKEELNLEQARKKLALLMDISRHTEKIEKDEERKKMEWNLAQAEQALEDNKELYAKQAIAYREVEKQGLEAKEAMMNLNKVLREIEELTKKFTDQKKELEVEVPSLCQQIDDLKEQIKNCVVYSPISGIVRKTAIEKNQKVEYGTLLLSVGDQSELIARGSLKEANFFLVKIGQPVELNSDAFGKTFKGNVLKVIPAYTVGGKDDKGEKDGGWEVVCSIANPEGLRIGMELSGEIIIKEKQASGIVIPPEALYEEDCVLVVENGRIKKKKVTIGEGTTDQIEVLEGLKSGERVVVQYPEEVKEGMKAKEVAK